jgi:hypothetical protein
MIISTLFRSDSEDESQPLAGLHMFRAGATMAAGLAPSAPVQRNGRSLTRPGWPNVLGHETKSTKHATPVQQRRREDLR